MSPEDPYGATTSISSKLGLKATEYFIGINWDKVLRSKEEQQGEPKIWVDRMVLWLLVCWPNHWTRSFGNGLLRRAITRAAGLYLKDSLNEARERGTCERGTYTEPTLRCRQGGHMMPLNKWEEKTKRPRLKVIFKRRVQTYLHTERTLTLQCWFRLAQV